MVDRLKADVLWYLRFGPTLPIRVLVLFVWLYLVVWSGLNLVGVALNLIGAQFIASVEEGRACSIPLWNALPRNAILDFLPGTTPKGLISTVVLVVMNLALFVVARWVLAYHPNTFRPDAPQRAAIGTVALVNIGALFGSALIFVAAIVIQVISIGILFGGDSNAVDLRLPGTCSFLRYR